MIRRIAVEPSSAISARAPEHRRNRLVLLDDVDLVTLIESEVDRVAIPHIVRSANSEFLREIHDEMKKDPISNDLASPR